MKILPSFRIVIHVCPIPIIANSDHRIGVGEDHRSTVVQTCTVSLKGNFHVGVKLNEWRLELWDAGAEKNKCRRNVTKDFRLTFYTARDHTVPANSNENVRTSAINKSIKQKNKLYKQYLKRRSDDVFCKYKNYKNKLTSILRKAERMHYLSQLDNVRNNLTKTWKILNSIISRTQTRSNTD